MKKILSITLTLLLLANFFSNAVSVLAKEDVSENFGYTITNGEVSIYEIHKGGDVKIPQKIEGYPVTSIDTEPDINPTITSLIIPEGVKDISVSAFENCNELSQITLPDSLESIGTQAFMGTAYYNDDANWENGVLYIGKHLIEAKTSLSGEYKIKEGTLTIAGRAFERCKELNGITIPESVKGIGTFVFADCIKLEGLTISKDNKYFSAKDGIVYNKNQTQLIFASPNIKGNITLPKSLTSIREGAFQYCNFVKSVTLPDGIKEIGDRAFYACDALEKINIPDSVNKIGDSIIYHTPYYKEQSNWENHLLYVGKHLVDSDSSGDFKGTCTIKEGTLTIADETFCYRDKLKKVYIPDSVIYLGEDAFWNCQRLTSVRLSKNIKVIGNNTFFECYKLKSINLPEKLERIEANAFYECSSLDTLYIPNSVNYIGTGAFYKCRLVKELNIPKGIKSIEANTFNGCSSIKKITVPNGVTAIGNYAFENCTSLKEITLPNSLKKIGKYAFENATKISKVVYKGTKAERKKISIQKNNSKLTEATWTYRPEKVTSVKKDTSSKNNIASKDELTEEVSSSEKITTNTDTQNESQNTHSAPIESAKEEKQNNTWLIWLFIAVIVVGAGCGFAIFRLITKNKG